MKEIIAVLDDDTAGELGAIAAAHGFAPDILAAAFIVEGVQLHIALDQAREKGRVLSGEARDAG